MQISITSFFITLSILTNECLGNPTRGDTSYHKHDEGCEFKENDDTIYVHLIPHSHDDVGWLKTVEEYFEGTATYITQAAVTETITTMVTQLAKDPARRFTQVEMKFFSMFSYNMLYCSYHLFICSLQPINYIHNTPFFIPVFASDNLCTQRPN